MGGPSPRVRTACRGWTAVHSPERGAHRPRLVTPHAVAASGRGPTSGPDYPSSPYGRHRRRCGSLLQTSCQGVGSGRGRLRGWSVYPSPPRDAVGDGRPTTRRCPVVGARGSGREVPERAWQVARARGRRGPWAGRRRGRRHGRAAVSAPRRALRPRGARRPGRGARAYRPGRGLAAGGPQAAVWGAAGPNNALEPTPNSLRSCVAPAIGRGSPRALGSAGEKPKNGGSESSCFSDSVPVSGFVERTATPSS